MSRCCGFVVDSTANPQQIESMEYSFRLIHNKSNQWSIAFDKSTTNRKAVRQIHSKSTTNRNSGVWLSTNPQQFEKLYDKSKSCTTNPQQIEKLYDKSKSCTTNPQQIEQVEFELYSLRQLNAV
jgi:hypothetical protein